MEREALREQVQSGAVAPKDLPAGHNRDEAKRIAQQALEELAEEKAGESGDFAFDPSKLDHQKVENEIVGHFDVATNEFTVPGEQPDYTYKWIAKRHQDIAEIKTRVRRVLGPGVDGYQKVTRGMPEFKAAEKEHLIDSEGNVYVGDLILFRCKKDVAEEVDRRNEEKAIAPLLAPEDQVISRADRYGKRYVEARRIVPGVGSDAEAVRSLAVNDLAARARDGRNIGPLTVQNQFGRRGIRGGR